MDRQARGGRTPVGVRVHFHDIFLPHDYPADWGWRGYNEQLAVAALVVSGAYEVEFASAYLVAQRPEWLSRGVLGRLPLVAGERRRGAGRRITCTARVVKFSEQR